MAARRRRVEEGGGAWGLVALAGIAALILTAVYLEEKFGPDFLTTPDEHGRTPVDKLLAAGGALAALGVLGRFLLPRMMGGVLGPIGLAAGILAATGVFGWVADALGLGGAVDAVTGAVAGAWDKLRTQGTRYHTGGGGAGTGGGQGGEPCPDGRERRLYLSTNADGTVSSTYRCPPPEDQ